MRDELAAHLGPIELSDLRAHLARDGVILVAPSLDLLDVAEAIAKDDKELVERWVGAALVAKPSLEDLARWHEQGASPLTAVVVQPFVLVQERADPLS
jgi:hypothetical protein